MKKIFATILAIILTLTAVSGVYVGIESKGFKDFTSLKEKFGKTSSEEVEVAEPEEDLSVMIESLNTQISCLEGEKTALEEEILNLTLDLETAQSSLVTANENLVFKETEISNLENEIAILQDRIITYQTTITSLNDQIEVLENELNSIEYFATASSGDFCSLSVRLDDTDDLYIGPDGTVSLTGMNISCYSVEQVNDALGENAYSSIEKVYLSTTTTFSIYDRTKSSNNYVGDYVRVYEIYNKELTSGYTSNIEIIIDLSNFENLTLTSNDYYDFKGEVSYVLNDNIYNITVKLIATELIQEGSL